IVAKVTGAPVPRFVNLGDSLDHELKFRQEIALRWLRKRLKLLEHAHGGELILIELPRRDLLLHPAAKKVGLGHVVDREQPFELREFHRAEALAGLERADSLFADTGKARYVLLAETLEAADFTKFEYEIHGSPHFRDQNRRIRPTTTPCPATSRAEA